MEVVPKVSLSTVRFGPGNAAGCRHSDSFCDGKISLIMPPPTGLNVATLWKLCKGSMMRLYFGCMFFKHLSPQKHCFKVYGEHFTSLSKNVFEEMPKKQADKWWTDTEWSLGYGMIHCRFARWNPWMIHDTYTVIAQPSQKVWGCRGRKMWISIKFLVETHR